MTYIACPFCGGGIPGVPCKCTTSLRPSDIPFSPMPVPSVETPPTPRENELLKRIKALVVEVERMRGALQEIADQKTWAELTPEEDETASYIDGHAMCIERARAALAEQERKL